MDEAASQKEAVEQQLNEVLNAQVKSVNQENISDVALTDIFLSLSSGWKKLRGRCCSPEAGAGLRAEDDGRCH